MLFDLNALAEESWNIHSIQQQIPQYFLSNSSFIVNKLQIKFHCRTTEKNPKNIVSRHLSILTSSRDVTTNSIAYHRLIDECTGIVR